MSFVDVLTRSEPKQKENTPKMRRKELSTMKDSMSSSGSSKVLRKSTTRKGTRFSQLNNEIVQLQVSSFRCLLAVVFSGVCLQPCSSF